MRAVQPVTYRWADRQRSSLRSLRRLNLSIGVLCAAAACLLAAATLLLTVAEPGISAIDALYLSVMTFTTIGYGDIEHPASAPGRR